MALEVTIGVMLAFVVLGLYLWATTPEIEGSLKVTGMNIAIGFFLIAAIVGVVLFFQLYEF
jgi:hypothetical protein